MSKHQVHSLLSSLIDATRRDAALNSQPVSIVENCLKARVTTFVGLSLRLPAIVREARQDVIDVESRHILTVGVNYQTSTMQRISYHTGCKNDVKSKAQAFSSVEHARMRKGR